MISAPVRRCGEWTQSNYYNSIQRSFGAALGIV